MMYILRVGDRGQEVTRLQKALGKGLAADGIFGPRTEDAVREYQKEQRLSVDGLAGKATLGSLGIPVLFGIDVSSHNGTIAWKEVAMSEVEWVIIKVTEGTTHQNPGYEAKFRGARDAGLRVGGYHFSRIDTNIGVKDVYNEAQNYLEAMAKVGMRCGDLVPALDLESGLKTDDQYNVDWALEWLSHVECSVRARPIIYTAKWAWDLYLRRATKESLEKLCSYPVWWASYKNAFERSEPYNSPAGWAEWSIWQTSGSYEGVPGLRGKVDTNWMAGDGLATLSIGDTGHV